jgi:hypothetical protein
VPVDSPRKRVLARRWVAAACVAAAAAGMFIAWRVDEKAQPCWAARQMIDFNRTAQASLKAKTHFAPAGSYEQDSVPTDADYRAWLDGLQQRADRVTGPDLSAHAHRAAELARQFMARMDQANAELGKQDPLTPQLPPSAKAAATINRQFGDQMGALEHACPA